MFKVKIKEFIVGMLKIYHLLIENKIEDILPIIEITLRILLSMMVPN